MDTEIKTEYVVSDANQLQVVLCAFVPVNQDSGDENDRSYILFLPWQLAADAAFNVE